MDEDTLYNMMKDLPDFDCYPIPQTWFKKYNIPPRNVVQPKEFMESKYTLKIAYEKKDLPPLIIDKPQQNGKLYELVVEQPVPVELVSRPFELKDGELFPTVLPSLTSVPESVEQDHQLLHHKSPLQTAEPEQNCQQGETLAQ